MKKIVTLIAVILFAANVFAQSPEKMSYQAVVRNASNGLISNTTIGMKISILQGSSSGTVVYAETQSPTTDANGLATLEIGTGSIISGVFSTVNWSAGPYFIKTETDPSGGTTYTITGTSQLLSVPYALHAKTATNFTETDPKIGTNTTGYSPKWNGSTFVTGAVYQDNLGKVGIGTTSPAVTLDVVGAIQTNDYLKISNTSNASKTLFQILNGNGNGINMGVDNASYTNPYITFSQPANSSVWKMNSNGSTYTIKNNYNNAFISLNSWDTNNGEVILGANGVENFRITNQGNVGIGTTSPSASAQLDVSSTTKGFLLPRMTSAQMSVITPVEGLMIYNTTSKKLSFYNGTEWQNFDGSFAYAIGDNYQGGKIAYILQPGDPGYIAGQTHGLIAAASDQSAQWGCEGTYIAGATGTTLGTGNQNTIAIMAGCATAGIAARLCGDLVLNGYSDWYLPSRDELNLLCINSVAIGGFTNYYYWSSSEFGGTTPLSLHFPSCTELNGRLKSFIHQVRAVRAF